MGKDRLKNYHLLEWFEGVWRVVPKDRRGGTGLDAMGSWMDDMMARNPDIVYAITLCDNVEKLNEKKELNAKKDNVKPKPIGDTTYSIGDGMSKF